MPPHTAIQTARQLILAIEDETTIIHFLRSYLESQGFRFIHAVTAAQGMALAESKQPQLILLDLGLPDQDGLETIKQLRTWTAVPIIVISAREQERDKILSLDLGADDYLTKPFSVAELSARIRVALRHAQQTTSETPVLTLQALRIDLAHRQVWLHDQLISLTPIQFELLAVLARQAGKVVTHQQLLKKIWNLENAQSVDYVRIYIHQLRHKLETDPARPQYLHTEPGVGYRLWCEG